MTPTAEVDSVRYAVLGSGSSANSYIFQYRDEFSVIVDNGFSCRELLRRIAEAGFDASLVRYILVTHTHKDHFAGVPVLSRKLKIPVVFHERLTRDSRVTEGLHAVKAVKPGAYYRTGDFRFCAVATSHDSPWSLSYQLQFGEETFFILTDTGDWTQEMVARAAESRVLFLESNYCPEILAQCDYPDFLKRRISSDRGHLSNQAAVRFLKALDQEKTAVTSRVFFCHLSDNSNTVDRVRSAVEKGYQGSLIWTVCPKGELVPGDPVHSR